MHHYLRRLDLNLLLVFEALLRLRSGTAASDELSISPSALSHALSRLRVALADDLFVRVGNTMQPTVFAESMAGTICGALEMLSQGLSGTKEFDPRTSDRTFFFAATDYTAFTVFPRFVAYMQKMAPGLRFKVSYSSGRESTEDLIAGRIDFSLGYVEELVEPPSGIEGFELLRDDYVVITNSNHPTISRSLSLEQYLSAKHAVVTPWNEPVSVIGNVLNKLGLQRDEVIQLPSLLAAPFIISQTDLIMTLPHCAAKILQNSAPIAIYPAPFPVPPINLVAYWNERHKNSKAHAWMREQLLLIDFSCGKPI